ncbi:MAG: hypothetical protein ACUVUR_02990 [bacterium]
MKRMVLSVVVITTMIAPVLAQPLPVRLYGDSLNEQAYALVEAVDRGFCLAGWTRSYGPGTPNASNVLIIKTDPQGTPVWARISVGMKDDEAYSMVKTNDNCYVLCGMTRSYGSGSPQANIFVTKLSQTGNTVWSYVYGGNEDDIPYSIIQTSDRGFALTGLTNSFGPLPTPNMFVLKLDSMGRFLWLRVYWMFPNHVEDEGHSIAQTLDNGLIVCGRAKATNPAQFDAFLLRLNAAGIPTWLQIVPGDSNDEARSVAIDNMEHILVAGWTASYCQPGDPANLFVGLFDYFGTMIGSWNYGWANGSEMVLDDRSLISTPDTGIVVCGPTTSVGPGLPNPNILIMKLNYGGGIVWARSHPSAYDPGFLNDVPLPLVRLNWGGYALAGYSNSYPQRLGGGDDFILSTFDAMGNRPVCADSQMPEIMPMVWVDWDITDSLYQPELDTMSFIPVQVRYDSVCYDTSGHGINDGALPPVEGYTVRWVKSGELELNLSSAATVNLALYSLDGRMVQKLVLGKLDAGRHRLMPKGGLNRGVYLGRLVINKRVTIVKLVRY